MSGLEGLAFSGGTKKPAAQSPATATQPTASNSGKEIETSFIPTGQTQQDAAPRTTKAGRQKKLQALSPEAQLAALDARRQSLGSNKNTKRIDISLPATDYARILDMAEAEYVGGSMSNSFTYFVAWCLKVGIKYYEEFGLTHNNPDKITFNPEEYDAPSTFSRDRVSHRGGSNRDLSSYMRGEGPSQTTRLDTIPQIHPILGRRPPKRYIDTVEGGEDMSPPSRPEDLELEKEYLDIESDDHEPAILEGENAFDRAAMRDAVKAFLPASAR